MIHTHILHNTTVGPLAFCFTRNVITAKVFSSTELKPLVFP